MAYTFPLALTRYELPQEVSRTLCWGNAQIYNRSLLVVTCSVGRGFMPGSERVCYNEPVWQKRVCNKEIREEKQFHARFVQGSGQN